MKVNVYSKDITVTGKVEQRVVEKLAFLDKYLLISEDTIAQTIIKKLGGNVKVEITIPSKVGVLRSEVLDSDLNTAIDDSVEKLEDQLRRQKTRLSRRHKEKLAKTFIDDDYQDEQDEKITRIKRVVIDDLDPEEAIMQMELLGHSFFAYKDVDTKIVSILYKKEDGNYGVLELV